MSTRIRLNENQLRRMVRRIIAESNHDTVVGDLDMRSFMKPYEDGDLGSIFVNPGPRFDWLRIPGVEGEYSEVMRTVPLKYGQGFENYAEAYLKLSGSLWNILKKFFKNSSNTTRLPKWVGQLSDWSGVPLPSVGPFEDKTNDQDRVLEYFKSLEVFVSEAMSSHMNKVFIPLANSFKSDPESFRMKVKEKTKEIEKLRLSSGDLRNAEINLYGEAFLRSRGIR